MLRTIELRSHGCQVNKHARALFASRDEVEVQALRRGASRRKTPQLEKRVEWQVPPPIRVVTAVS